MKNMNEQKNIILTNERYAKHGHHEGVEQNDCLTVVVLATVSSI